MKMQFSHAGRQFFFVTITIDGRKTVLSRLVDERSRPALESCGEIVKSLLLALHGAFPCATVSDFVIMPDHVHFLLIVDYAKDPAFSPLWATHRLMDAAELLWERTGATPPNPQGAATKAAPQNPREAAEEALAKAVALARLQRGRLTIANTARGVVGPAISGGSGAATGGISGGSGARPPSIAKWNRHCYIELSLDARQLKAIRRYIRLNPARALWKARHPDRFVRLVGIRHAVLDPSRSWDAMGNATLLASPFLRHVRLTMRKTAEEHAAEIGEIVEEAANGIVPVCGFISPGEKELLRRLKAEPRARFIKTVPFALPPRYDPSAEDSRELAADRLLILSGFPQGTPDSRENLRARCNLMNGLAAAMCERAQTLD